MEFKALLQNCASMNKCECIVFVVIKELSLLHLYHSLSSVNRTFTHLCCSVAADENSVENERKEDEYFQKMYEQWKGVKAKDNVDSTYKVIPKFYFKVILVCYSWNYIIILGEIVFIFLY